MLKDTVRTRAYMNAIMQNSFLFKGKVVLDVGCGTGILSMFAAKVGAVLFAIKATHHLRQKLPSQTQPSQNQKNQKAGAEHVYAIECSSIAEQAKAIVADNGLADRVTVVHGKAEEVSLPVDKVDIIISEWMGYFLLYESMLDTVIFARDRWLAPGGLVLPDLCRLMVAGIEDGDYRSDKIDFWDSVYGFDMRVIKELALAEPLVDAVNPDQVATTEAVVRTFDITRMRKEDAAFEATFELTATKNDFLHALVRARLGVCVGGFLCGDGDSWLANLFCAKYNQLTTPNQQHQPNHRPPPKQ
jgi:protein arginine N-methyltransferase 1